MRETTTQQREGSVGTAARTAFICYSGLWSGCSPIASGTTGSAAAVVAWAILFGLGITDGLLGQLLFPIVLFGLGIWSVNYAIPAGTGVNAPKAVKDPSVVVVDEWVGQGIALIGVTSLNPLVLFAAFFLFRLFDVLKPGFVRTLERKPGAWGVMLDDVGAGLLALIVLRFGLVVWALL